MTEAESVKVIRLLEEAIQACLTKSVDQASDSVKAVLWTALEETEDE